MNLAYMMVGKPNIIEIGSSVTLSSSSSSVEKSASMEDSVPSSAEAFKNRPSRSITPVKLSERLNFNKGFDISSIFAKKTIEVISSDEKSKSNEIKPNVSVKKQEVRSLDNALYEELQSTRALAQKSIETAEIMANEKEIEMFGQKAFFLSSIKELQERNQRLLNENVMLKEIQIELERSAEKITIFKSKKTSLSICSYLYDSWKNRESKSELYQKYIDKSQQYDELLTKYQDLEAQLIESMTASKPKEIQEEGLALPKKRGRIAKVNVSSNKGAPKEPVLTKQLLKSFENKTSNGIERKIQEDQKSAISANILRETADSNNRKGKTSAMKANVTPSKRAAQTEKKYQREDNNQKEAQKESKKIPQSSHLIQGEEESADFDDNKSCISTNTNKKDPRRRKVISKERKKYLSEQQDTAFNSIADTLFNF